MAYTEFYTNPSGSNLNAGSTTATTSSVTSTNGDWGNAAANRFTAAAGTPFSGVSAGEWASVYLDGATVGVYVARVTAVNGGGASVDLSATAKSGTAPATGATGRTCKIGGAWKGPNAAESFPIGFAQTTMTNSGGDVPRINMKNGANYDITAAMTEDEGGVIFQGYTSSPGDGGMAIIDGGTGGASYILLTVATGNNTTLRDLIFANNGATGNAGLVSISSVEPMVERCVFHDGRGAGLTVSSTGGLVVQCEAYANNKSNNASTPGINISGRVGVERCISHDNTGSNTDGFILSGTASWAVDCISDTNGRDGFNISSVSVAYLRGCDAYANAGDGIDLTGGASVVVMISNCNLIKNGGWGIQSSGSAVRGGSIRNCGFGAGTEANTSGTISTNCGQIDQSGTVTYASNVTPWNAPTTGDFRISLSTAKGAGMGSYTETASSYTGTVGYPDIGAAQHQDTGGGGQKSYVIP